MNYICNCSEVNIEEWKRMMKGKIKCSYSRLVNKIKRENPDIYNELGLKYSNPWAEQCGVTPKYYILVHSAIEYFFEK